MNGSTPHRNIRNQILARISTRQGENNIIIFLLLLPAFILFFGFQVYPILQSVYYSFFDWTGFGAAINFVGIENYLTIFQDEVFQKALTNALLLIFLSLIIQLPLALALAISVGRDLPGRIFFRTIFFLPYVISEVITAIIWANVLFTDPSSGLVNAILVQIPGVQPIDWLGDMNLVFYSLFIVLTWKFFGLHMLLYLAGLQGIPLELEEAARMDGANGLQVIWHITLPMLRNTIATTVYLSVLGSIQQFVLVWVLTQGGPSNASEMLSTYMYRFSFIRFSLGYGSAVALVMLVIALTFSIGYNAFVRSPDYLGGAE
jgi:raffinose/stachyose/melibiose transport system permease protein